MGIKYVGRTTNFKGKPLWEILANLKNFGVGRIVVRSQHQKYSEPCYMRILKVAALPNTSQHFHDPRKVVALVQRTFRGQTPEKPIQIHSVSYKADYILVPKDQEAQYVNANAQVPCKIMPKSVEFPPLLKELLIAQAKQKKIDIKEPRLLMRYNFTGSKNYRVAEEGETPTVDIKVINCTIFELNNAQEKAA